MKSLQDLDIFVRTVDSGSLSATARALDLTPAAASAALKRLEESPGVCCYNLGTGHAYSVLDVLHAFERAAGKTLPYVVMDRRPGDVAAFWADPSKAAEELGWRAKLDLDDMCRDSWNWQQKNPRGYRTGEE